MRWWSFRRAVGLVLLQVLLYVLSLGLASTANAQNGDPRLRFVDTPLRDVIERVEQETDYRFLYRDAVVADVTVSFSSALSVVVETLVSSLRESGIAASVDSVRKQIMLAPSLGREEGQPNISGIVVDDDSGDTLPFATVTWEIDGRLAGTVSDESGRYTIATGNEVHGAVRFSYVGFEPLVVERSELHRGFTARLQPRADLVSEIVVSANPLIAEVDSVWGRLLSSHDMRVHGESNAIRALQALPAVSISGAMSSGTVVRGSRSDGFQVLLDGIPVYSPSHFFGLFDAFNADALRSVGLFYGVSPAEYAGPPGGTLSFVTRGGSKTRPQASLGVSTTSFSGTMESPLFNGRGSLLIAGRRSLFDLVEWFDNDRLISLGLDVDRESSVPSVLNTLNSRVLRPGASSALFYDLHGKLLVEDQSGKGRWIVNAYLGGDDTGHAAERLAVDPADSTRRVELRDVRTDNSWHNEIGGLRREGQLGANTFYRLHIFASAYGSDFQKDDYSYAARPDANPRASELLVDTLTIDNTLADRGGTASVVTRINDTEWTAGIDLHDYSTTYDEYAAPFSRRLEGNSSAAQFDTFVGATRNRRGATSSIGLRAHYYSPDARVRLSPRLLGSVGLAEGLVAFAGYARSHQFLHQLYIDTAPDARLWTLSTKAQPPGRADHITGGMRLQRGRFGLQVETYYKESSGIRQHETVVAHRRRRDTGLLLAPWVHDYDGRSSGLEVMLRRSWSTGLVSAAYTLSRSELKHDEIENGEWTFADWDRRHQIVLQLRFAVMPGVSATMQWQYGSEAPNVLANRFPDEPERLSDYHRMDVSISSAFRLSTARVSATASIYNVYDRNNTWYRTRLGVLDGPVADPRIRAAFVDVYDLGFRPSLALSIFLP